MSPQRTGIVTALAALALDQLSKNVLLYGAGLYIPPDQYASAPRAVIPVLPFFDMLLVWNRGVSYGLFQAEGMLGTVLLTVLSLAAVIALSWWLRGATNRFLALGLGLIIGGALGNVIDRIVYGAVADFFHFYAFGHDWYVFNVADAAIVVGVIVLIADAFARDKTRDPAPRD